MLIGYENLKLPSLLYSVPSQVREIGEVLDLVGAAMPNVAAKVILIDLFIF